MLIRNKAESDYYIKKLNLNRIDERVFTKEQLDSCIKFLSANPDKRFNMRDKSNAAGKFHYNLHPYQVAEYMKEYDVFSVYESLAQADGYLILQGEMQINKDFKLIATLDDRLYKSNRIAMKDAKYHVNIDLLEDKDPSIPGFSQVVDYIITKELFDVVVEFSKYMIPVGVLNEKIVIWELRNY